MVESARPDVSVSGTRGGGDPRSRTIVTAIVAVIVVLAAGLVIQSMVTPFEGRGERAERLLAKDGEDAVRGRAAADEVLRRDPLEARLVAELGFAAERDGSRAEALTLIETAHRLSRRETAVEFWLFEYRLARRSYGRAFDHFDALLRRRPERPEALFSSATSAMSDRAAVKAMADTLAKSPLWRPGFLYHMATRGDADQTRAILDQLRRGPAPPTDSEISVYLNQLLSLSRYEEARRAAQLLSTSGPARTGGAILHDGGFEGLNGPEPFNWTMVGGVGGLVALEFPPDRPKNSALHIIYDGFSSPRLLHQTMALAPGRYVLVGEAMFEKPQTADRLVWTITCIGDGRQIMQASAPRPTNAAWGRFSLPVEIPSPGCGGQILELKPVPGDRNIHSEAWFDNLTVRPEPSQ